MQEENAAELLAGVALATGLLVSSDQNYEVPDQLFADSSASDGTSMDDISTSNLTPTNQPMNGNPPQADVPAFPAKVITQLLDPLPLVNPAEPPAKTTYSPPKPTTASPPMSPAVLGNDKIILVPMNQGGATVLPTNINVPPGQNIVFIKPEDLNLLKNVEGKNVTLIATKTSPVQNVVGNQHTGTSRPAGGQPCQALPNMQVSQVNVRPSIQTGLGVTQINQQAVSGQPRPATQNMQVEENIRAGQPNRAVSGQPCQATPNTQAGQIKAGQPTERTQMGSQVVGVKPHQAIPNMQAGQNMVGQPIQPTTTPRQANKQVANPQMVVAGQPRQAVPNMQASQNVRTGLPTQAGVSLQASVPSQAPSGGQHVFSGLPKNVSQPAVLIVRPANQVQAAISGQVVKPVDVSVQKGIAGGLVQVVKSGMGNRQVQGTVAVTQVARGGQVTSANTLKELQTSIPAKVSIGKQQMTGAPVGQVLKKIFGQPQVIQNTTIGTQTTASAKPTVSQTVSQSSTQPGVAKTSGTEVSRGITVPSSPVTTQTRVPANQSGGMTVPQSRTVHQSSGTSYGITIVSKTPISIPPSRSGLTSTPHKTTTPSMFPSASPTMVPLPGSTGPQKQNPPTQKATPAPAKKNARPAGRKPTEKAPELPSRGPTLQDTLNQRGSWSSMGRLQTLHAGESQLTTIKHHRVTASNPWNCSLCGYGSYQQTLGCLYGPYDETKDVSTENGASGSGHKRKQSTGTDDGDEGSPRKKAAADSSKEIWLHADCAVWSPGIYTTGDSFAGYKQAVADGKFGKCTCCGNFGATLVCFERSCKKLYHFICAKKSGCIFNESNYTIECDHHK